MEASKVLLFAAGWILVNPKPISSYLGSAEREHQLSTHLEHCAAKQLYCSAHGMHTRTAQLHLYTCNAHEGLWICPLNYVQLMHRFKKM